jgi:hypothetical protein
MNDGTVWVSVDQGGLLRFDGSAWEAVRPLGGAADLPIGSLVGDPGGVIWVDVLIGPDERTRARFDGAGWSVPAHAQPEVGSPTDDRPVAVAPDGTLWTAARAEHGRPFLWAIDDEQRRMVPDLIPCSDAEPAATGDCAQVISVAIGPDGLVWLVVGNVDRDGLAERGVALLAVDPTLALTG